ncbi:MAG: 2Fe-2S iron-sulfur cluster-binding protein, partial [Spirochaetaceae bacterium]|nr:2Fe-2S iron-sulfur cluster-binding protein [Spirochaetaceae bacterium]
MAMVHLEIDGRKVEVPEGASVLEAARSAGADIPTLCHIEGLEPYGGCRLCLVEIEGFRNGLASACSTPAAEGMRVGTATDLVVALRREVLSLILAEHPSDCFNCKKSGDCGLHRYCAEYGVVKTITGDEKRDSVPDISSPFISLDRNKCILCGKCVRVCERLQLCDVLDFSRRGRGTRIGPAFDLSLA